MKRGLLLVALAVALSGCIVAKRADTVSAFSNVSSPPQRHAYNLTNNPAATNTYRITESERVIQVGDFLLITFVEPARWVQGFWGSDKSFPLPETTFPALDQQVKKDGAITLLFNWEFNAVGKKTSDLEKEIRRSYVPEKFGDLTVGIRMSTETNFVYVGEGFRNPGRYSWANGMRLKNAIEAAGGFGAFADGRVRILHLDGTTEKYWLREAWSLSNNPTLKPGDRVSNPREI
jgi:protein involved in polysaccharide export with SLBB domain